MPWSVKYDQRTKIVEVIYSGTVTQEELKNAIIERLRIQNQHKSFFVLIDCSQVERNAGGILDVHDIPEKIYEIEKVNRRTCHALALSKYPNARKASFHYETVCNNRGWRVKIFENREDAVGWLQEEMESNNLSK